MSLPHLLLVDDSESILNFEKAVLSGLYRLSTARNGQEALDQVRSLKPDGILLDLSMPVLDGDEALKVLKADPDLASIPVLIVSSEKDRAEACLKVGADALLHKPVVAEDLKARVALMLEAAQERERRRTSAYLLMEVGTLELGLPLRSVLAVHSQPATRQVGSKIAYLNERVDYYGETLEVLDLPAGLGLVHSQTLPDRKLVFLNGEPKRALCVDRVYDPEELPPTHVHAAEAGSPLQAWVDSSRGRVPILDPQVLLAAELPSRLAERLGKTGGTR